MNLAVELARLEEIIRQQSPAVPEAVDALVGIRRQLAAAQGPAEATERDGDSEQSGSKQKNRGPGQSRLTKRRLTKQLIDDVERLKLMLVSKEAASQETSEAFNQFRESVIAVATQRRKHLADLAFLHSLLVSDSAGEAADAAPPSDTAPATDTAPLSGAAPETPSVVLAELEDMFKRCGGTIITEYSEASKEHFEVSGNGTSMQVLRPAYLAQNDDGRTMVVARGAVKNS